MATLEEQIRELEARRAKGEVVPKLDALYKKQDDLTRKGYDSVANPDRLTPGKLQGPRAQPSPKETPTPKMRSMPEKEALRSLGEREMDPMEPRRTMPPMEPRRPMGKPRSMNADRDKAYDTDVNLKKGGKVSSASKRADGCAQRGKTKGRMV
jgi:hypothetical protein